MLNRLFHIAINSTDLDRSVAFYQRLGFQALCAPMGATGHFGRLTVEALLRRGVPAEELTATGRRTETLTDLAERGVTVRRADFVSAARLRAS